MHGEQGDHQAAEQRGDQQGQPGAAAAEDCHRPAGVPLGASLPARFTPRDGDAACLGGEQPWQAAINTLARRWTAKAHPNGWGQARAGVEPGLEPAIRVLEDAGFVLVADRNFVEPQALSFEAVLGYLHSTSVASRRVLGDDADAFAAELKATLTPFADPDGMLHEEMSFGYTLFRSPD